MSKKRKHYKPPDSGDEHMHDRNPYKNNKPDFGRLSEKYPDLFGERFVCDVCLTYLNDNVHTIAER